MYKLSSLKPRYRKKSKRVGRGTSSGHGKTGGRGNKGQKSRAGGTKGKHFEGGQTPLYRRLPKKRGFKNYPFRVEYKVLNVSDLEKFDNEAGIEQFKSEGLIKDRERIKILGSGKLTKALKITAHAFSKSAKEIIEKSGGQAITC
ncbi:50S ribosomal protein L15 [Candidatus Saganbacteria bacterium]|nr:50S ribosomal protein L15 [Candidatus Saganbacteria bacterium]